MEKLNYLQISQWLMENCQPKSIDSLNSIYFKIKNNGKLISPSQHFSLSLTNISSTGEINDILQDKTSIKTQLCNSISFDLATTDYKLALCIDIGKSSLTVKNGSLILNVMVDSLEKIINVILQGMKFRQIDKVLFIVLLYNPEMDTLHTISLGELSEHDSIQDICFKLSEYILKSELLYHPREINQNKNIIPSLNSFVNAVTDELRHFPNDLMPIVILLVSEKYTIHHSSLYEKIAGGKIILHLIDYSLDRAQNPIINCNNSLEGMTPHMTYTSMDDFIFKEADDSCLFIPRYKMGINYRSIFNKTIFKSTCYYNQIFSDSLITLSLEEYSLNILRPEYLVASRLSEGFYFVSCDLLADDHFYKNGNNCFNTFVFHFVLSANNLLIYEIKLRNFYRSNQHAATSWVVVIKIKLKCPKKCLKYDLSEKVKIFVKKLNTTDVKLNKFCDIFFQLKDQPISSQLIQSNEIMDYTDIISLLKKCESQISLNIVIFPDTTKVDSCFEINIEHIFKEFIKSIPYDKSVHILNECTYVINISLKCTSKNIPKIQNVLVHVHVDFSKPFIVKLDMSAIFNDCNNETSAFYDILTDIFMKTLSSFNLNPSIVSHYPKNLHIFQNTLISTNKTFLVHKFKSQIMKSTIWSLEYMIEEYIRFKLSIGFTLYTNKREFNFYHVYLGIIIPLEEKFLKDTLLICEIKIISNEQFSISYIQEPVNSLHFSQKYRISNCNATVRSFISDLIKQVEEIFFTYNIVSPYFPEEHLNNITSNMTYQDFEKIKLFSSSFSQSIISFDNDEQNLILMKELSEKLKEKMIFRRVSNCPFDENLIFVAYSFIDKNLILIHAEHSISENNSNLPIKFKLDVYAINLTCWNYKSTSNNNKIFQTSKKSTELKSLDDYMEPLLLQIYEKIYSIYKVCYLNVAFYFFEKYDTIQDLPTTLQFSRTTSFEYDLSNIARHLNDIVHKNYIEKLLSKYTHSDKKLIFTDLPEYTEFLSYIESSSNSLINFFSDVHNSLKPIFNTSYYVFHSQGSEMIVKFSISYKTYEDQYVLDSFPVSSHQYSLLYTILNSYYLMNHNLDLQSSTDIFTPLKLSREKSFNEKEIDQITSKNFEFINKSCFTELLCSLKIEFFHRASIEKTKVNSIETNPESYDIVRKNIEIFVATENLNSLHGKIFSKNEISLIKDALTLVPEVLKYEIDVDFILNCDQKKEFPLPISQLELTFGLLVNELENNIRPTRYSETLLSNFYYDQEFSAPLPCWIVISILSYESYQLELEYNLDILSISFEIKILDMKNLAISVSSILESFKESCHRVNQMNLLVDLHDRHYANPLLIPLSSTSTSTSTTTPKSTIDILPLRSELFCVNKTDFRPGCYTCKRQDQIICTIQEIQGWNQDVAVNGLINSVFHPFALSNSDRHFVFQDKNLEICYMSFDTITENNNRSISIGIYGRHRISNELIRKLKHDMDSKLLELAAKQISTILSRNINISGSTLHRSHVNFLKDSTGKQQDIILKIPFHIRDLMHYSLIARQLLLGNQILTAPLSSRISLNQVIHPSILGYNIFTTTTTTTTTTAAAHIRANSSPPTATTTATTNTKSKLSGGPNPPSLDKGQQAPPPMRPMLKRNKHVELELRESVETLHPVFFGSRSRSRKAEGRLVIWNPDDFTFLYNELGTKQESKQIIPSIGYNVNRNQNSSVFLPEVVTGKTQNVKHNVKNNIGLGLALIDFSILSKNLNPVAPNLIFTGSSTSISSDMETIDSLNDGEKKSLLMNFQIDSRESSSSNKSDSFSSLDNNNNDTVDYEPMKTDEEMKFKLRIFPTVPMNLSGLSNYCSSIFNEALKAYYIERCCLYYKSIVSEEMTTINSNQIINEKALNEVKVSIDEVEVIHQELRVISSSPSIYNLIHRINTILLDNTTETPKNEAINSLSGNIFYTITLSKSQALDLQSDIIFNLIKDNSFLRYLMRRVYIDPTELKIKKSPQLWQDFSENKTDKANITIFSNLFHDPSIQSSDEIESKILFQDYGGNVAHLMPSNILMKHFLIQILTTASGINILYYNISYNLLSSIKKIIRDILNTNTNSLNVKIVDHFKSIGINHLPKIFYNEEKSSSADEEQNSKEILQIKQISARLSWRQRRLSKLSFVPREPDSILGSSSHTALSNLPISNWRGGILKAIATIPLPYLYDTNDKNIVNSFFSFKQNVTSVYMNHHEIEILDYLDCFFIIKNIPLTSVINVYEFKECKHNYIEIYHRIIDIFEIIPKDLFGSKEGKNELKLLTLDEDPIISNYQHKLNITNGQKLTQELYCDFFNDKFSVQFKMFSLSILYKSLAINPIFQCNNSNFYERFLTILRWNIENLNKIVFKKWSKLSLIRNSNHELLNKTMNDLDIIEIVKVMSFHNTKNKLFIISNEDKSKFIFGCLFNISLMNSDSINKNFSHSSLGLTLYSSDFKSNSFLSLIFPDFIDFNFLDNDNDCKRSSIVIPISPASLPLVFKNMQDELEREIIISLNKITHDLIWNSLLSHTPITENDIIILLNSSKFSNLEFLSFLNSIFQNFCKNIEILFSALELNKEIAICKFMDSNNITHVIFADNTSKSFFGLHASMYSSKNEIIGSFKLIQHPYIDYDDFTSFQHKKKIVEIVVNAILQLTIV